MSYTLTYGNGGLADAAQYIQSKGRNEDTQLVHMTPSEVDALQSLAQQHGGSLTINPHTGLPEAGFLSSILSVAAPIALNFAFPGLGAAVGGAFGATGALASGIGMGLISGGLTALTTGDLGKGLTSGIAGGVMGGLMAPSTAAAQTANMATSSGADAAAKAAAAQAASNTAVNTGLNQAGTSMMNNPSIIAAGAAPVATAPAAGGIGGWWGGLSPNQKLMTGLAGAGGAALLAGTPKLNAVPESKGTIRPYTYASNAVPSTSPQSPYPTGPLYNAAGNPILPKSEQRYFNQSFTPQPTYAAANGGLMAVGGMTDMYPQSQQVNTNYATPTQMPVSNEIIDSGYEPQTDPYNGMPTRPFANGGTINLASGGNFSGQGLGRIGDMLQSVQSADQSNGNPQNQYTYNPITQQYSNNGAAPQMQDLASNGGIFGNVIQQLAQQATQPSNNYSYDPKNQQYTQMANGGIANLGGYSDGGRLLRGPGDGVSDSIPASIGDKQPARLADGEFVVPARIVSELGNGSTDAGAKRLYAMMDRVQSGRKKSIGKSKVAVDSKAAKYLPA